MSDRTVATPLCGSGVRCNSGDYAWALRPCRVQAGAWKQRLKQLVKQRS
jgi:hypothetical protein